MQQIMDNGDSPKNLLLTKRVSEMRNTLDQLKQQLYQEKILLQGQHSRNTRHQLHNKLGFPQRPLNSHPTYVPNERMYCEEMAHPSFHFPLLHQQEPSVPINKEHLRDIERKCDTELQKLDCYIQNVQQLKSMWIEMREAENMKRQETRQEFPEKVINQTKSNFETSAKKYPKGRIFYL